MEKRNKKQKLDKGDTKKSSRRSSLDDPKNLAEEYNKLKAEEERLDKEIAVLENRGINTDLNPQMEALHSYNKMKDVAQMVLGYLADAEQTTVGEIHKRYNLPVD